MTTLAPPSPPGHARTPPTGYVRHYPMAFHDYFARLYRESADNLPRIEAICRAMPLMAYRPMPTARLFHMSRKTRRWMFGGTRSGKSQSHIVDVLWAALGMHPWRRMRGPLKCLYAAPTFDDLGKIAMPKFEYYLRGIKHPPIIWGDRNRNIPSILRLPARGGGMSELRFGAYSQGREAFQGFEADVIANDEQFPQDIYVEQLSRVGADRQVNFSASLTPIDPQPWLEERIAGGMGPEHEIFEMPLDQNRLSLGGFIQDAIIDGMIADWPEEIQATRRGGKWGAYLGAVFKTFGRGTHVVKEDEERQWLMPKGEVPPGREVVCGLDWGGANPFCFVWFMKLDRDDYYQFDEYYWNPRLQGVRLIEDHRKEIVKRFKRWGLRDQLPQVRIYADHDPQDVAELANFGLSTQPAKKEPVTRGIERMQQLMKVRPELGRPRLRYAERCRWSITQTSGLHYPKGTSTKDPGENPEKKDDHAVDPGRYVVYSEYIMDGGPQMPDRDIVTQEAPLWTPSESAADQMGGPWSH